MTFVDALTIVYVAGGMLTITWAAMTGSFEKLDDPLPGLAMIFLLWWLLAPAALGEGLRRRASGMSTGTAKTPKAVEGQSPASPVANGETPKA